MIVTTYHDKPLIFSRATFWKSSASQGVDRAEWMLSFTGLFLWLGVDPSNMADKRLTDFMIVKKILNIVRENKTSHSIESNQINSLVEKHRSFYRPHILHRSLQHGRRIASLLEQLYFEITSHSPPSREGLESWSWWSTAHLREMSSVCENHPNWLFLSEKT